jgi:hypothetical protein
LLLVVVAVAVAAAAVVAAVAAAAAASSSLVATLRFGLLRSVMVVIYHRRVGTTYASPVRWDR